MRVLQLIEEAKDRIKWARENVPIGVSLPPGSYEVELDILISYAIRLKHDIRQAAKERN